MQSAINSFYSMTDTGQTPCRAAIHLARQPIANDSKSPSNAKYIIIYISDVLPDPEVAGSVLASEVQAIFKSAPRASYLQRDQIWL